MKNKGIEISNSVKIDRLSDEEGSNLNTSQTKTCIKSASKEIDAHMRKRGKSNEGSRQKCRSNGLQFERDIEMIESMIQDGTSHHDIKQSNTGNSLERKSYTILSEKHIKEEKPSNKNSNFYVEDLNSEDEIYTFQCPENYIKQDLVDDIFDFGKVNKVVDVKTNEVLQLNVMPTANKSLTIAMPSKAGNGVLVKLPIKGHMHIKKIVEIPFHNHKVTDKGIYKCEIHDEVISELKTRHPLLGINWKMHIKLADEVIERQHMSIKKNKKTKREKKIKVKEKKSESLKRKYDVQNTSLHLKKKKKMERT